MRCSMPGDPRRVLAELAGPVAGGQHDRRRAVGDRRNVVSPKGIGEVRPGQQLVDALRRLLRVGALGSGERIQRHLRHLLGRPLAGVQAEAGLQPGHRHRVRPQRRDGVRVGLQRKHPAQRAGRRLAEAVDQRGVDLTGQQLDVGLIQCPRGVHLDVRLVDRRHRADRVDRGDERECPAGKVIRRAGAPEADVGLLEAELFVQRVEAGHQHFDAVGGAVGAAHMRRMGESDDSYIAISHVIPSYRWCL